MASKVFAVCLVLSILLFSQTAHSIPYLYTFSGDIKWMTTNGNYIPTSSGNDLIFDLNNGNVVAFNYGDILEYQFVVDINAAGTCAPASSTQCDPNNIVDNPNPPAIDYFYAELLYANKSAPLDWFGAELNWGLRSGIDTNTGIANKSQLSGSSAISVFTDANGDIPNTNPSTGNLLGISPSLELDINNWIAENVALGINGTNLIGQDAWYIFDENNEVFAGNIYSALTLKSIDPYDIPEPSTFTLLALSLLFVFFRYNNFDSRTNPNYKSLNP